MSEHNSKTRPSKKDTKSTVKNVKKLSPDIDHGFSFFDYRSARKIGQQRLLECESKAVLEGFSTSATSAFIFNYLINHGPTPGEELVLIAKQHGFIPHDDRAFGAVFAGLSRADKITCVGYCTRQRGHGTSGGRIWASA